MDPSEVVRRMGHLLRLMARGEALTVPTGHRLTIVDTETGLQFAWVCNEGSPDGPVTYLGAGDYPLQALLNYAAEMSEAELLGLVASHVITEMNRREGR